MKKLILVFVVATFISLNANPQHTKDVPAKVKAAFGMKFPGAQSVHWGKENANEYEAEFVMDGIKMSANYGVNGTWLETESNIPVSQLPAAAAATIAKQYPKSAVIEADKIERAGKGTLFEAVIETGAKKKEVLLNENGVIQK